MSIKIQKKYDLELLKKIIERDKIIVNLESLKKINSLIYLDFICKCGNPGNKTFRTMFEKGSLCRQCTIKLYNINHKASLKKSTGFEYALQSKEILQKKKNTCMKRFNVEHATQSDIIKEKTKQTCIARYNCEFVSQVKETREKIKNTWFNNYGVYNPLQSPIIKAKVKLTCLKKYGVPYSSQFNLAKIKLKNTNIKKYGVTFAIKLQKFKDKRIQTSLNRYGVTSAIKLQKFKDKRTQTCLNRYGVTSVSHVNFPSKCFKFKNYIFPCNTKIFVQGYEPYALDDLIKEGYLASDIVTCRSKVPEIWYYNDKKHRYFVDIYLPKINKMIEVKSIYTFNKHNEIVLLKAKECVKQGYDYEIWIYDNKGKNKTIINTF